MTSDDQGMGLAYPAVSGSPAAGEPDLDAVQRIARATCTELHRRALESGYRVRPYPDPGSYQGRKVFSVIYHAFATGLIQEVPDEP